MPLRILIIFLILLALPGCKPTGNDQDRSSAASKSARDWPVFRSDTGLRGATTASLPENLSLLWSFKTERAVKSSPVIVSNTVYVGSNDGKLYALTLDSGSNVWQFDAGDEVEAPPLYHDGIIYAGSANGNLYALDAHAGTQLWTFATGNRIVGSANWAPAPDTVRGLILVGSYDNTMYCLDAHAGTQVWTYTTGNYINGAPAIADGRAVFGGCDAKVHVISTLNGSLLGEIPLDSYIAGSAAVDGSKAYVGHYGNALVCVDLQTFSVDWQYSDPENSAPFFSSPALSDTCVIAGSRDYRVHCVDRVTGKKVWTVQTKGDVDSSPVICGDSVFAASCDGRLYRISLAKGTVVWTYEIGGTITASPAVASGMLVIGAEDGRVYAFGREQ